MLVLIQVAIQAIMFGVHELWKGLTLTGSAFLYLLGLVLALLSLSFLLPFALLKEKIHWTILEKRMLRR